MAVLTDQEQAAACLLFSALIGFLAAEAPMDEQSFPMVMELLNCMEGEKEDGCQDAVDILFEDTVSNTHRHEEYYSNYQDVYKRQTVSLMNGCGRTESAEYRTATTQRPFSFRTSTISSPKTKIRRQSLRGGVISSIILTARFISCLLYTSHRRGRFTLLR